MATQTVVWSYVEDAVSDRIKVFNTTEIMPKMFSRAFKFPESHTISTPFDYIQHCS
ncbi:hypothetical protein PT974_09543 [Cladobotryum mycophilum]|uniref:Uncharacterized protein n=1 Tax=Cladobotryum mycophilum TaxID=491253 RepID=A0ABR0SGI0_9HYPO